MRVAVDVYGALDGAALRAAAEYRARELGVGGWLRLAAPAGEGGGPAAEAVAEGRAEDVERFVEWLLGVGAPGCRIDGGAVTRGGAIAARAMAPPRVNFERE